MEPLIGAIDEGTSSARFILFKAGSAEIVAQHQQELGSVYPQEGWVEQDPLEILRVVRACIQVVVERLLCAGGHPSQIQAIGISNQRESTIVWDKITGEPLHNAIIWRDMRTSTTVNQLLLKVPNNSKNINYLQPLCGLPLSPYFSAVKFKWLHDNVLTVKKAVSSQRCLFGTVDSWLIWNLTKGVHVTDVSNASRTMLMNLETLSWDPFLLNFFGVPSNALPKICPSSQVYGRIVGGPLDGVRISGCLGDQQAALVGQQCIQRGQAKVTFGTGCFLLYNTGKARINSNHGLLTTVAYQLGLNKPPIYALEGSVAVAGYALNWLRDNMNILSSYEEGQQLAERVHNDGVGDVYFVPAFSGLYAPHWRQDARGVIVGISEHTNSTHIVRAALEAVCYQVRDILEAMKADCGGTEIKQLQVDGGMTKSSLLMQMQADLTGLTVIRRIMAECSALGAAMVAGAAVGYWNFEQNPVVLESEMWKCSYTEDERDIRYSKWKLAIEKSVGWDNSF